MESRLRALLLTARPALPALVVQHEVVSRNGQVLGRLDLAYVDIKLGLFGTEQWIPLPSNPLFGTEQANRTQAARRRRISMFAASGPLPSKPGTSRMNGTRCSRGSWSSARKPASPISPWPTLA
jgi:hypothetical protein